VNSEEQKMLSLLVDSVQQISGMLGEHQERLNAHQELLVSLSEIYTDTLAEAKLAIILNAELLAHLSQRDQSKFDEIVAGTVAFAEAKAAEIESPAILKVLSDVVEFAEDAFRRSCRQS